MWGKGSSAGVEVTPVGEWSGSAGWNLDPLGAGDISALGAFALSKSREALPPQKHSLRLGRKCSFAGGVSALPPSGNTLRSEGSAWSVACSLPRHTALKFAGDVPHGAPASAPARSSRLSALIAAWLGQGKILRIYIIFPYKSCVGSCVRTWLRELFV